MQLFIANRTSKVFHRNLKIRFFMR